MFDYARGKNLKVYTFCWLSVNIVTILFFGGANIGLGTEEDRLIETVLLSTDLMC